MLAAFALLVPVSVVVAHDGAPEVAERVTSALAARGVDAHPAAAPLSEACARNPACPDRPHTERIVWVDASIVEVITESGDVVDHIAPLDLDVASAADRIAAAARVADAPPAAPASAPSSAPASSTPEDLTPYIVVAAAGAGAAVIGGVMLAIFATESPAQQQQDAINCVSWCGSTALDNCLTAVLNGCFNVACGLLCSGFGLQNAARPNATPAAPALLAPPSTTNRRAPSMRY